MDAFENENDHLLKKYNTIWDKFIKTEFDRAPVYNKKYIKVKIKSDGDEVTDRFLQQQNS